MSSPNFSKPEKRIFDGSDLVYFQKSLALKRLHLVISVILNKVKGQSVPKGWLSPATVTRSRTKTVGTEFEAEKQPCDLTGLSSSVGKVIGILDNCNLLIDETPPFEGPRRYGNLACREWHVKIEANAGTWLQAFSSNRGLNDELGYYLLNSFGSALRLDYGSGHELSYVAFIGGLMECGFLERDVLGSDLLAIFARYYEITRRLIVEYNLEPAGSHGVWGLDDHFHFIYILGAAQFNPPEDKKETQYIPPVQQVLTTQIIDGYKESNLYVNAIAFIFKIKLGPFNEHSPIIYDIHHSVSLWSKVLSGLLKMYEVEVFGKVPVVQHFWFGNGLYPWKDAETKANLPVKQIEIDDQYDKNEEESVPGLINGFTGTKTTRSNITLTAAPWARSDVSQRVPDMRSKQGTHTQRGFKRN
ncbi:CIC11C00000004899 [Sungouiella intermedia]|uniref:Serine/threonine-protein phosphatase 2A activator n=1 Tax=Sungouiella intermedia TaxID=45354 RepID=A0A1L0BTA6_9ASCO|nr:CIC11C00000004899 [[Candida] intermedia]